MNTATAQVRGISYTISPVGEQILFDKNAGLERAFLYGGEVGFGFGRLVELDAVYVQRNGLTTDFSGIGGISDETREKLIGLTPREVDMQRYGGKLKINLPTENVVPFVTLDAGIVRFQPEHLNATRSIYLGGGGGLQFSVGGRYALSLSAQRFAYRYNLGSTFFDDLDLADLDLAPGSFNQTQVYNWALRAGLQAYVGGRTPGEETDLDRALREQLSGGLRGLSLRLEPFASQLAFDERLGFRHDQRFAGLFAGFNLGPYVGVRGFYWRAVEGGLSDFDQLQAYGGEMRFELTTGQSLSPYLTVGGGYMDVLDGYVGRGGAEPNDEPFVLTGIGAMLPINESLSLSAGARSVLMGKQGVDNVDDPGEVRSSWMYSGGLNFSFGGRRGSAADAIRAEIDRDDDAEAALRAELEESQQRLDSLARALERIRAGEPVDAVLDERITADTSTTRARTATDRGAAPPVRTERREPRMVTIPLPEEGELYVRFGEPGGVSIETVTGDGAGADGFAVETQTLTPQQIEQIVRQTVREQLRETEDPAVTNEQIDRIEESLRERLDELEQRLQSRLDSEMDRMGQQTQEPTTVVVDADRRDVTTTQVAPVRRMGPESVRPYAGVLTGDPNMGLLGVRLNMDTRFLGSISFQPEFAMGLGAETYAFLAALDAAYAIPYVDRVVGGVHPYVALGVGMLGFNEAPEEGSGVLLTVNGRVGADLSVPYGSFFAEFGTLNLVDYMRFAVGYRFHL